MSCISSIFALYIPYDFSFHTEMSSLESYGLRLVTPVIAMIVVPLAARFRYAMYLHCLCSMCILFPLLHLFSKDLLLVHIPAQLNLIAYQNTILILLIQLERRNIELFVQ